MNYLNKHSTYCKMAYLSAICEQEVLRFQVTVDNVFVMKTQQGLHCLKSNHCTVRAA